MAPLNSVFRESEVQEKRRRSKAAGTAGGNRRRFGNGGHRATGRMVVTRGGASSCGVAAASPGQASLMAPTRPLVPAAATRPLVPAAAAPLIWRIDFASGSGFTSHNGVRRSGRAAAEPWVRPNQRVATTGLRGGRHEPRRSAVAPRRVDDEAPGRWLRPRRECGDPVAREADASAAPGAMTRSWPCAGVPARLSPAPYRWRRFGAAARIYEPMLDP